MSNSDSDTGDGDFDGKTTDEILYIGLKILGFSDHQIKRQKKAKKNLDRFTAHFGVMPHVLDQVWEDMQDLSLFNQMIKPIHRDFEIFLQAVHFLKRYQTENEREGTCNCSIRKLRDINWQFIEVIQELKHQKIKWVHDNRDIWVGTVDGTNVDSEEPTHPTLPKDRTVFSKKHNLAGFVYELALSLHLSKIIWMNGTFKASIHDKTIFTQPGDFCEKLRSIGKKMIADSGYRGKDGCLDDVISRLNSRDKKMVAKLKIRARCRQESLNAKLKTFKCLDSARFRHGTSIDKFKMLFEAVAVLTQYRMELGDPVFDV